MLPNLQTQLVRNATLICWFLSVGTSVIQADPLDHWNWRNPLPQGNRLNGITYGGGQFVAVGELGIVLTSSDATNWIARDSQTFDELRSITYGNGLYATVGAFGRILTSSNGVSWTDHWSGTFESLSAVAYGGGKFVAVTDEGGILTSDDGDVWSQTVASGGVIFTGITFGNGTFVATGAGPNYTDGIIMTSSDGFRWTRQDSHTPGAIWTVVPGNGSFVAIGYDAALSSSDGIHWSSSLLPGYFGYLRSTAYGQGVFVTLADNSSFGLVSADGVDWKSISTGELNGMNSVVFGNGQFVAVGTSGAIVVSLNGSDWSSVGTSSFPFDDLTRISYLNGLFVATGQHYDPGVGPSGAMFTSADGQTWARSQAGSNTLFAVAYGNGRYVSVGDRGGVVVSTNAVNWYPVGSGSFETIKCVAFGNGLFVAAAGYNGSILTSPDGLTWTNESVGMSGTPYGITYGNGLFVLVGSWPTILTSTDTVSWAASVSTNSGYMEDVTFGNGRFVASGQGGTILTSTNGLTWIAQKSGTSASLPGVAYGDDRFVVVGGNYQLPGSIILVSANATDWKNVSPLYSPQLYSVAFGNNSFVTLGSRASILQSDPLAPILGIRFKSSVELSLIGIPGRSYDLDSCDVLAPSGSWQRLTTISLTTNPFVWTDPQPASLAGRFYRARQLP